VKKVIAFLCFLICSSVLIITLRRIYFESQSTKFTEIIEEKKIATKEGQKYEFEEGIIGILIIPKLDIEAVIKEGTSKEILKYSIRTL